MGGGEGGGDSRESGDRLGEAGAAQERSSDSNCARLEERESEPELAGEVARSRRLRFAGHAHSRSDSLSHSDPGGKKLGKKLNSFHCNSPETRHTRHVVASRRRQ